MSSTNKTTNYQLSQFIGTDKPTWLSDYNGDMSKIDAQMKLNADGVTTADGKADTNAAAIGTLSNLTTEAKNTLVAAINEVDSNANTAQSTANTAVTTSANADSKASQALANTLKFNFTNTGTSTLTAVSGSVNQYCHLYYAANSDGTVGKIYGILISDTVAGQTLRGTSPFRPQSKITITGIMTQYGGDKAINLGSFTVDTDGTIEFTFQSGWGAGGGHRAYFPPCVYFMDNFGDVPVGN